MPHLPTVTNQPFPVDPGRYPEVSQATTALVMGILGILICGILSPFAWSIGTKELAAIDSGLRSPENRQTANAGRILGIVDTVLLIIGLVILTVVVALILMGVLSLTFSN